MANDLYVQLFAPTTGGLGRIGTAYPVAKNVLLTAAHNIKDLETGELWSPINKVEARWWKRKDLAPKICQQILWDGTECDYDVMLLACPFPEAYRDDWRRLEHHQPRPNQEFNTQGFARVAKRAEARRLLSIQGKTCEITIGEVYFDVIVTAGAPVDEAGWKGASGSPIFVDDQIVGVVGAAPREYEAERLRCTPVCMCLEIDGFRTHLFDGDEKAAADFRSLKETAADKLGLSPDAQNAFETVLGLNANSDVAKACIDEISAMTAGALLDTCIRAQKALSNTEGAARKTIKDVCLCLLPAVFRFRDDHMCLVREHMEGISGAMLSIPVDDDEAVFELYMAGAGGREMRLRYDGQRWRPAEELFSDEGECGPTTRAGFAEHVHRKIIRGRGTPNARAKRKIVQKLKNDADYDRYRHYFVYRERDYTEDQIKEMAADFDGLIIFAEWAEQVSDELANEEFNIMDILNRIMSGELTNA